MVTDVSGQRICSIFKVKAVQVLGQVPTSDVWHRKRTKGPQLDSARKLKCPMSWRSYCSVLVQTWKDRAKPRKHAVRTVGFPPEKRTRRTQNTYKKHYRLIDLKWQAIIFHTLTRGVGTFSCTSRQFYVPPTQCIYVFCMDLRTNSVISLYNHNWLVS